VQFAVVLLCLAAAIDAMRFLLRRLPASRGIIAAHQLPSRYTLITTLQIDTWNRDKMDISGKNPGPVTFVPGPLPAASEAPTASPEYSGLLECPMTTR
jgi:hypothetical protein